VGEVESCEGWWCGDLKERANQPAVAAAQPPYLTPFVE
jgi:hypothetical protein